MEGMQTIDDVEIQEKVESLAGKGVRVIDCEKSSSYKSEEVLLVNGYPVPLQGEEGKRIKTALITGQVPPCELLNDILLRAGILKNPVELETTLNVKSTTKTTELVTLRDKDGVLVDERMKEVEEDNEFNSSSTEVWKKEDEGSLLGLGKQIERITLPSSSSHFRRNGSPFGSTPSAYQHTPTPTHSQASQYSSGIGSASSRLGKHASSPQPPLHFNNYHSTPYNNNSTFSSPSPEASSRSPSSSSYSYSPRFSVSSQLPSIVVHTPSDKTKSKISNSYSDKFSQNVHEVRRLTPSPPAKPACTPSPVQSRPKTPSPTPARTPSPNTTVTIRSAPPSPKINMSPKTYRKINESQNFQELRSTNCQSPPKFFAPTLSTLHIEFDGMPIRVSYETFV